MKCKPLLDSEDFTSSNAYSLFLSFITKYPQPTHTRYPSTPSWSWKAQRAIENRVRSAFFCIITITQPAPNVFITQMVEHCSVSAETMSQKILLKFCYIFNRLNSRKYSYLPQGRDNFSLSPLPPSPIENSNYATYHKYCSLIGCAARYLFFDR